MRSDLFKQHLLSHLNSLEEFAAVRKELLSNFSAASFLAYLLHHTPLLKDFYLDALTGHLHIDNFSTAQIAARGANPYSLRLSRNITGLFPDFMLRGHAASSLVAMSLSLLKQK